MSWLVITISAYFILAGAFLVDKYLLTSSIPNPKIYAFYVGLLGVASLLLVPVFGLYIPEPFQLISALLAGAVFIYALSWFYKTLKIFEASRAVPAVGGLTPIFTFLLIYVASFGKETFSLSELMAFVLLILGSVFINLRKDRLITIESFKYSILSAFLFSLAFVLTKYAYLGQPFWNGFIWRALGGFIAAILFYLVFPEVRKDAFKGEKTMSRKTKIIFFLNQAGGTGASILQNWAIFLAPLASVPLIQALNGTQYVFILLFAVILSLKFPQFLKEEISGGILAQKIIAMILIAGGLAILAL